MIGNVKLNYFNQDIIELIKKDIINKFGQRELLGINLSVPDIFKSKAQVTAFPEPTVTVITVEEQLQQQNRPKKQNIRRADNSIKEDEAKIGGEGLVYVFERSTNTLVISGGQIGLSTVDSKQGYFVGLEIGWPLGITFEESDQIPLSINGVPIIHDLTEEELISESITLYLDAIYKGNDIIINWGSDFEPEKIKVLINAKLVDSAETRYEDLPTAPIISIDYPDSSEYVDAIIRVDVDLALGFCGKP